MEKFGVEERIEAYKMLLNGSSHIEVAEKFGVSRQRVYQLFSGVSIPTRRKGKPVMYPNIERWLDEHDSNVNKLASDIGIVNVTLWRQLRGRSPLKASVAEKISRHTGIPIDAVTAKK